MVKNLPAMQETQVWSLGQEDSLEQGMTTLSSILPGEFHGQRSLAHIVYGVTKELDDQHLHFLVHLLNRLWNLRGF